MDLACPCFHILNINVTGPVKVDHVSTNYTKLYFANIFCPKCSIPIP